MVTFGELMFKKRNKDKAQSNQSLKQLRKNYDNPKFNDVSLICSDGKTVSCSSFMLRLHSDIFDSMLDSGDDCDESPAKVIKVPPRFSSDVMEHLKHFCHLGMCIEIDTDKGKLRQDMELLMDVLVAGDFYAIEQLTKSSAENIVSMLRYHPVLSFLVLQKFGVEPDDTRPDVAKIIKTARARIASMSSFTQTDLQIASSIRDHHTLQSIVVPLVSKQTKPLAPLVFLDGLNKIYKDELEEKEAFAMESLLRRIVQDTQMIEKIAEKAPQHLFDPSSILNSCNLVPKSSFREAVLLASSTWKCVFYKEEDGGVGSGCRGQARDFVRKFQVNDRNFRSGASNLFEDEFDC